jgi:predicted DNA binding protein
MTDEWRKPYHVVIEVENRQCRILKKFASLEIKHLKVADIRSSSSGAVKHLIELDREQVKKIPKDFKIVAPRGKAESKPSIWFESEGCEVCNSILSRDAFLISGKSMEEHTIKYSFIVATFEANTRASYLTLEASGHTVNVLKIGSFEPKTGILTEKQQRLFWLA